MHVVITGANGFIGRNLAARLLADTAALPGGARLERLSLLDLDFRDPPGGPAVRQIRGSFADAAVLARALEEHPADLVFHLASVPSGLAERDFALGMEVNVNGTARLLERLRDQGGRPTVVFASSIAVYGKPGGEAVGEDTPPTPNLSYGAQKVIGESLVWDYCRRGWIAGCSLRLPGIVTRPPEPNGAVSIFFSDLIRNLAAGEAFTCPVSREARSWLMSVRRCVDNLLRAARLDMARPAVWTVPALHAGIGELVDALDALFPANKVRELIHYEPDPWVEDNFGSYPPLHTPRARAAGLSDDGSLRQLILDSFAGSPAPTTACRIPGE